MVGSASSWKVATVTQLDRPAAQTPPAQEAVENSAKSRDHRGGDGAVEQVDEPDYCSYERFGSLFFEHAVTSERVLASLSGLVGKAIEIGPMGAGPGRVAKVTANRQDR